MAGPMFQPITVVQHHRYSEVYVGKDKVPGLWQKHDPEIELLEGGLVALRITLLGKELKVLAHDASDEDRAAALERM